MQTPFDPAILFIGISPMELTVLDMQMHMYKDVQSNIVHRSS